MGRFEGKTVLITGGSSGIGLAGAKLLIAEGAEVIVTGRTESHLAAAAAELGEKAIVVHDDASDGKTLERLLPVVKDTGGLDGLWLNAAYGIAATVEEADKEAI